MGECYLNGAGGTALNFRVVRYSTEAEMNAATPRNNTIGIVTDVEITEWIISKAKPDNLQDGALWIKTGTSSQGEFNALQKNGIIICPIAAYQCASGNLVERIAKTFLDDAWRDWEPSVTYLFTPGNQYNEITGGWSGISGRPGHQRRPCHPSGLLRRRRHPLARCQLLQHGVCPALRGLCHL